jgi:hypothetical protein
VERGLGKREIVKGPKRHRVGGSAQQEPCEQREQQERPEGTPGKSSHGSAVAAPGVAVAGRAA